MVPAALLLPELEPPPELLLEVPPPELLAEAPGALLLPQATRPTDRPTQTRIALMLDFIFPCSLWPQAVVARWFVPLLCYGSTP
jgi:hypothetical protein